MNRLLIDSINGHGSNSPGPNSPGSPNTPSSSCCSPPVTQGMSPQYHVRRLGLGQGSVGSVGSVTHEPTNSSSQPRNCFSASNSPQIPNARRLSRPGLMTTHNSPQPSSRSIQSVHNPSFSPFNPISLSSSPSLSQPSSRSPNTSTTTPNTTTATATALPAFTNISQLQNNFVQHAIQPTMAASLPFSISPSPQPTHAQAVIFSSPSPIRTSTSPNGTKQFFCTFPNCGLEFKSKFSLKRHFKRHNGVKPFACNAPNCDKQFAEKSTLIRHMRVHSGERPYTCTFEGCNRSFADRTNIRRHEMTHTGERPYDCPDPSCSRGFFRKKHLYKHVVSNHPAYVGSVEKPN